MTDNYLGISQPVSIALPTPQDLCLSESLITCLKSFDLFESETELQKRVNVLSSVQTFLQDWVKNETKQKLPNEDCSTFGGKLCTLGSYRLRVHNRGADIDTLCVVPRHIDRKDFFGSFYSLLKTNPSVSELHAVPDAFVPVIKLRFDGIELDILFARVAAKTVPDDYSVTDDSILKNVDDYTIRSLNGCRVAEEILSAVPNIDAFTSCLRAVKHWAMVRGIYSNTLGFFGGVTYAILVARVCQLYPNAAPAKLFHKFFYVYSKWGWHTPVLLKQMNTCPVGLEGMMEKVWDPRVKKGDRQHLMPVITPAFPQQNSTFNVSKSTKSIIEHEIRDGLEICQYIMTGQLQWSAIFEETNFFTRYRHFIVVACVSTRKEDHLVFNSFIESKLRILVGYLDRKPEISLAHINSKKFTPLDKAPIDNYDSSSGANLWFIGLEFNTSMSKNVDLTSECNWFIEVLVSSQKDTRKDNKIDVKYVHQKDIRYYITKEDMLKGNRHKKKKPAIGPESPPKKIGEKRARTTSVSEENRQRPENDPPEKKEC